MIPCHRVIGADGTLTGYAGGIERKQTLLEIEQDAPVLSWLVSGEVASAREVSC